MKADFIFRIWPYVAAAVLVGALAVRYALSRRRMDVLAEQLSQARALFRGGKIWRTSLLLLFLAHLIGLVLPDVILRLGGDRTRLYVLEGVGFLLGLLALGGWAGVVWRHFGRSRAGAVTELADSIFLALLLVAVGTGLAAAALYRWGSAWGAVTLSPYVTSLLDGDPITALAAEMPFLVQLHVFAAFALAAVLPFTRVAPFVLVALDRAIAIAGRPVTAANRGAEAWLRRHNPATWIWPEED